MAYDRQRVNRYYWGSRILRERGWQGVGDWPGTWRRVDDPFYANVRTFDQATFDAGIEPDIQAALWNERRAELVVTFSAVTRHMKAQWTAVKRSVEAFASRPDVKRALAAMDEEEW